MPRSRPNHTPSIKNSVAEEIRRQQPTKSSGKNSGKNSNKTAAEGDRKIMDLPPDLQQAKNVHQPMVSALLDWFADNKRDLPWRKNYTPYEVWVSEIMLQQTQMERGVVYYNNWMAQFPTLASVAHASEDTILRAWEGLGYYSRARNLHRAAKIIMIRHGGELPASPALLQALPGIGEYTAGAVASIAFNQPVPAVDANVERVFARIFDVAVPPKSPVASGFIRQMAELLLPDGKVREFNQALMELGALVCKRKPLCAECPLAKYCLALRLDLTDKRPVSGKKISTSALGMTTGLLVHQGRIFVQKRLETGIWAGLWEFPGGRLEPEESPEAAITREYAEETGFAVVPHKFLGSINHAYTRYRITIHCFLCVLRGNAPHMPEPQLTAASAFSWATPEALENLAMPAAHRKILQYFAEELTEKLAQSHAKSHPEKLEEGQ